MTLRKFKKPFWQKQEKPKSRASKATTPSWSDFFRENILAEMDELSIRHPNNELWFRNQVRILSRKATSTETVFALEKLLERTEDSLSRALLVKRIAWLRGQYLQSFKEYSNRALIQLCERQKSFDKWEGIHILGYFGGSKAIPHLRGLLKTEKNQLLVQAIERSIVKIERNAKRKMLERGF